MVRVQRTRWKVRKPRGKTDICEMSRASYETAGDQDMNPVARWSEPIFSQPFRLAHLFLIVSSFRKRKEKEKWTRLPLLRELRKPNQDSTTQVVW